MRWDEMRDDLYCTVRLRLGISSRILSLRDTPRRLYPSVRLDASTNYHAPRHGAFNGSAAGRLTRHRIEYRWVGTPTPRRSGAETRSGCDFEATTRRCRLQRRGHSSLMHKTQYENMCTVQYCTLYSTIQLSTVYIDRWADHRVSFQSRPSRVLLFNSISWRRFNHHHLHLHTSAQFTSQPSVIIFN